MAAILLIQNHGDSDDFRDRHEDDSLPPECVQ
jgi:hypothetical protein